MHNSYPVKHLLEIHAEYTNIHLLLHVGAIQARDVIGYIHVSVVALCGVRVNTVILEIKAVILLMRTLRVTLQTH